MHIAEGVLSPAVLGTGAVLTAAGTFIGLRRLDMNRLMTVAMLSAAFFVGSLVHVPIGVGNVHLLLNGLLGVLLGWAAVPAILVALSLQALFFQFGGLTTLGVNTATMGCAAVVAGWCFTALTGILPGSRGLKVAAFCGGALGVLVAALLTACALAGTDEGLVVAAKMLLVAHLPIMFIEGCITMLAVAFMARVRPEMLASRLSGRRGHPCDDVEDAVETPRQERG
ncbi:MAG: cobalt transporter CbiM [Desulfovibrio sp.]|jgi:cobalt/nickel transport system permease protein|nr:cobalt transporter CbiM [Desulfovibrio sp.]